MCFNFLTSPLLFAEGGKLKVLVVTGGHDYERAPIRADVSEFCTTWNAGFVEHPQALDWFKAENAGKYDVVVLYDMWKNISPDAQKDFTALV